MASTGCDQMFHVWDVRAGSKRAAASCDLPGKAFGRDASRDSKRVDHERPAGGTASSTFGNRCVLFFPDARGIAVGNIEGRVAIEYLDDIGVASGEFWTRR